MDEFGLIAKYLKPLATAPGALGLSDDAALLSVRSGEELVLTKDAIVCGIHFLKSDPLDLVAKKLLRVNISDLAAKGARPVGYLLACCWPKATTEEDIARFVVGLAEDQDVYGIKLLGGDTTATDGPLTLTLTAIGTVPHGRMVRRSGARAGDKVYVTGTIGDAGLGLKLARGEAIGASADEARALIARYRLPEPPLAFALAARDLMFASIDVSDGLIADAGHIAEVSGVAITIEAGKIPLSPAAGAWLRRGGSPAFLASCGDDYEICFTAPPADHEAILKAAAKTKTRVSEIGTVATGSGVRLVDEKGVEIPVPRGGFTHF